MKNKVELIDETINNINTIRSEFQNYDKTTLLHLFRRFSNLNHEPFYVSRNVINITISDLELYKILGRIYLNSIPIKDGDIVKFIDEEDSSEIVKVKKVNCYIRTEEELDKYLNKSWPIWAEGFPVISNGNFGKRTVMVNILEEKIINIYRGFAKITTMKQLRDVSNNNTGVLIEK